MGPHGANPMESRHFWQVLPHVAAAGGLGALPRASFTLNREAAALWVGVLIFERPEAFPKASWVAYLGSVWGSGSDLRAILFASSEKELRKRVEQDPWFLAEMNKMPDARVAREWREARGVR